MVNALLRSPRSSHTRALVWFSNSGEKVSKKELKAGAMKKHMGRASLRAGNWKLHTCSGAVEHGHGWSGGVPCNKSALLFHLPSDPGETKDVAGSNERITRLLVARLEAAWKMIKARFPRTEDNEAPGRGRRLDGKQKAARKKLQHSTRAVSGSGKPKPEDMALLLKGFRAAMMSGCANASHNVLAPSGLFLPGQGPLHEQSLLWKWPRGSV